MVSPWVSQAVVSRCPSGVSNPESLMTGIQYDAVPSDLPSGPKMVSAWMRGRNSTLSGCRCENSSSRETARGAAGGTAFSPSSRFSR